MEAKHQSEGPVVVKKIGHVVDSHFRIFKSEHVEPYISRASEARQRASSGYWTSATDSIKPLHIPIRESNRRKDTVHFEAYFRFALQNARLLFFSSSSSSPSAHPLDIKRTTQFNGPSFLSFISGEFFASFSFHARVFKYSNDEASGRHEI